MIEDTIGEHHPLTKYVTLDDHIRYIERLEEQASQSEKKFIMLLQDLEATHKGLEALGVKCDVEVPIHDAVRYYLANLKPLTWTTEKPAKPGFWWWRNEGDPSIRHIENVLGRLCDDGIPVKGTPGEWSSSPIAEPEEAHGTNS